MNAPSEEAVYSAEFICALESFQSICANRDDLWQAVLATRKSELEWPGFSERLDAYIEAVVGDFLKAATVDGVLLPEVFTNFYLVLQNFSKFAPSAYNLPFIRFEGGGDPIEMRFYGEFMRAIGDSFTVTPKISPEIFAAESVSSAGRGLVDIEELSPVDGIMHGAEVAASLAGGVDAALTKES